MKNNWFALSISSGLFTGYLPKAPGTWGSLLAILLLSLCPKIPIVLYLVLCLLVLFIGKWSANIAGKHDGVVDSPRIVIDEIAGILVTMVGIPLTKYWLFWGFVFFRILDITKPPPANYFDSRVKNAWGVMFDDIVAGIYANMILQLMLRTSV